MKSPSLFLGLIFLVLANSVFAQKPEGSTEPMCGSSIHKASILKKDPSNISKEINLNEEIRKKLVNRPSGHMKTASTEVYKIPVVVHVLHLSGTAIGTYENISDAQIIQAIADINDAFRNRGYYNPNTGVDIEIEFELAKRTPACTSTSGINRVATSLSNFTYNTEDDDLALKALSYWSSYDFINIWIVKEICYGSCGTAGYSTTPISHGNVDDGIVLEARNFGSTQDGSKDAVHELGHFFNLDHTFEGHCTNNDCLTDGDKVCDTPPRTESSFLCGNTNSCTSDEDDHSTNNPFRPVSLGGLGDQPDMTANYMDYTPGSCRDMFTQGQKDRMRLSLEGVRMSLLSSAGGSPVNEISQPVAASCTPATQEYTSPAGLFSVTVGDMQNITNSSMEDGGYVTYFCKMNPLEMNTNQSYPVKLKTGGFENVELYIDYNNDGDFTDGGELAFHQLWGANGEPEPGADTHIGTIVIPNNAVTDVVLRMRVISDYEIYTMTGPCYTAAEGQVEDYAVIFRTGVATATAEKSKMDLNLVVYPNPMEQQASIEFQLPQSGTIEMELSDVYGNSQKIYSGENKANQKNSIEIDKYKMNIGSGIYFLTVKSGEVVITKKLVVK